MTQLLSGNLKQSIKIKLKIFGFNGFNGFIH